MLSSRISVGTNCLLYAYFRIDRRASAVSCATIYVTSPPLSLGQMSPSSPPPPAAPSATLPPFHNAPGCLTIPQPTLSPPSHHNQPSPSHQPNSHFHSNFHQVPEPNLAILCSTPLPRDGPYHTSHISSQILVYTKP